MFFTERKKYRDGVYISAPTFDTLIQLDAVDGATHKAAMLVYLTAVDSQGNPVYESADMVHSKVSAKAIAEMAEIANELSEIDSPLSPPSPDLPSTGVSAFLRRWLPRYGS